MRLLTLAGVILALTIPTLARAQTNGATVPAAGNVCPTSAVLNVGNSRPLIETQYGQLCIQGNVTSTPSGTQAVNLTQVNGTAVSSSNPVPVAGAGTAGTPSGGVASVQGVSGGTNLPVSQATASALNAQVVGNIASASTDSGNPVKVGCVFNSTPPAVTTGQRVDCQAVVDGSMVTAAAGLLTTGTNLNGGVIVPYQVGGARTVSLPWATSNYLFGGSSRDNQVEITGAVATGIGNAAVDIAPTSAAPAAIVPSISASSAATSLVAKASAGNYYDAYCQSTAAGRCIVYNATAAPGAGALTAALVLECSVVAAGGQGSIQYGDIPRRASTGITILFSSSTDCNTYTASSTAYIHASVQ